MTAELSILKTKYQKMVGMRDRQQNIIDKFNEQLEEAKDESVLILQALTVITSLADEARQAFKKEVDQLVTLAVKSVFSEKYAFDLQMTIKNNRLQCLPTITETINGKTEHYTPKDDMGGSILDSIGFALRILLQKLGQSRTRPIQLLDEPMKNTGHGELLVQAGNMLSELSRSLQLQLIIITHDPELAEIGDRVWNVSRKEGVSTTVSTNIKLGISKPKRRLIR